ncbi:hypothetical protein [Breznakibacter xylanolyticus]|nr:hypothetical protein [Breznakibacter xylanolyticus]
MQTTTMDWMTGNGHILAQRNLDEKVIALLAESDVAPEKFYLTGFETITFNQNKLFALNVVLASVITLERSVLILNTGRASHKVAEICSRLSMNYLLLDDIGMLDEVLRMHRQVSHLFICEGDDKGVARYELTQIGQLAGKYKVDLIVECMQQPLTVSQAMSCGASFMIYVDPLAVQSDSMVVCRRSRLVQAEGQSRWAMFDLYQYWQKTLDGRNNVIEPMAV